ncbi:hypothetical protein HJC23_011377 [Cyclotella cryptica]|uniref:Transcription initiation factor IIF subunit alpha n=1 Tax=Cyclotella cryptica TaxID=29204 RepID=A0ABD3PRN4_9STRA|eukprot:CCRYP_012652-RA/>CCRYP_012652-RA protein AED:0.04 eAED:0.04 QI:209/1/1/1/1/1/2/1947/674
MSTLNPRKRPSPATIPPNGNTPPAQAGIDALLAKYARTLPPGGTVTVTLVKGPSSSSVDPIAARRAASNEQQRRHAPPVELTFPRVAKFPETITKPDFGGRLRDGRMYEEDVPKAKDESDEEESTAYRSSNANIDDPSADLSQTSTAAANRKKKRRWRRNDPRPKRWVLQEKAEFFERVAAQRRRKLAGGGEDHDDDEQGRKLSNQYHGVVESNASKYVILSVNPQSAAHPPSNAAFSSPSSIVTTEQITLQPVHGFHTFSQPYKIAALSMEEAENAIERQRNVVTRYMMHGRYSNAAADKSEAAAALASGVVSVARGGSRPLGPPPKAMSRARLLGKLAGGADGKAEEDDEDVMADIKFTSSRGSSRARKELLSSMADEGVTVDDDGVLGGVNDAEFGGKRRFVRVAVDNSDNGQEKNDGKTETAGTATGFEAGAMEEGFFQRDVSAEYEALDYDANEQFDDDDVNLGEDEIQDDGGGFAGGMNDSDDDMFDSEDLSDEEDDAFKGIASASGLKAMIAKARGESPVTASADGGGAEGQAVAQGEEDTKGEKVINKMLDAAKKTAEELEKKKAEPTPSGETEQAKPSAAQEPKAIGIEKDKDGKRLITMEAIRREIWLNNGAIKSKRLMRIFDVTAKNPERQSVFKSIVMELCTMKKDADGNKLVLKQHYAKSS